MSDQPDRFRSSNELLQSALNDWKSVAEARRGQVERLERERDRFRQALQAYVDYADAVSADPEHDLEGVVWLELHTEATRTLAGEAMFRLGRGHP